MPKSSNKIKPSETSDVAAKDIGSVVMAQKSLAESRRQKFERRWYDNNFFDDGFHFRYVSRTTGRVVDLANKSDIWAPKRAIPKASRQLRGMANLLSSFNFHPVIFPERINKSMFRPDIFDPKSNRVIEDPNYVEALKEAKLKAKRLGNYLEDEWETQELIEDKLPYMIMLAMKNSVSWMQVWFDDVHKHIKSQVYDGFDVYTLGHLNDSEAAPFVGKVMPKLLSEILANPRFDEAQRAKVLSDNRFAGSEIKEAYMKSRFGGMGDASDAKTSLLHEWYMKEILDEYNAARIKKQDNADEILAGKSKGDVIVRQVYAANNVWLLDNYVAIPKYPLVPLTLEPGPLYQVPQIERFIDANKSLDTLVSRIERYAHTMAVGIWLKREGESFRINNAAGGQVISYKNRPPQQQQIAPLPQFLFSLVDFMESIIEEQGVSTTSLSKIPSGVRSNAAIESLKASEFSNLDIPIKQVRRFIKKITERFIYLAGYYVTDATEVEFETRGNVDYFDIIGKKGADLRNQVDSPLPRDIIVIDPDKTKVRIDIETGPGYTQQGKRENMLEISRFLTDQAAAGLLNPESVKMVVERLLETYQFGSVGEFMEALNEEDKNQVSPDDIEKIKVAVLEVLRDIKAGGQPQEGGGTPPPAQPPL